MAIQSNHPANSQTELKVFHDDLELETEDAIFEQLPILRDLTSRFEMVTGWQLDFSESHASFQRRTYRDPEHSIFGKLEIDDLSKRLEVGNTARHRGYCDQLVETLDAMISTIQLDRQRFRELGTHLNPVVQPPFEWWGLSGRAGISRGRIANWSVSSTEKIQLFFADLDGSESLDQALSSAALFAAFETASQTCGDIFEYAKIFPSLVRKTSQSQQHLTAFATIELDPITGEYELDGFNASHGYAIIDVNASTVIQPSKEEVDGILYSGQILVLGIDSSDCELLQQSLAGVELSVGHGLSLLESQFQDSAAIFLYRK